MVLYHNCDNSYRIYSKIQCTNVQYPMWQECQTVNGDELPKMQTEKGKRKTWGLTYSGVSSSGFK